VGTPRRAGTRLPVRIDPVAWQEEVERYERGSEARVAAERERPRLERDGLPIRQLEACAELGPEGTRLGGQLKVCVPISEEPPSRRPYGFVFAPRPSPQGIYLGLVGYGERHPERPTARSVYERAHQRLHGRYPDQ
jgi:hypothetical protein